MSDYVVALTGGVASGKTAVEACFAGRGIGVYDADLAAREVIAPETPGLASLVEAFGKDVLAADGRLDRPAMRRRIFADRDARHTLEAIVHPRVRQWLRPGPVAFLAAQLVILGLAWQLLQQDCKGAVRLPPQALTAQLLRTSPGECRAPR